MFDAYLIEQDKDDVTVYVIYAVFAIQGDVDILKNTTEYLSYTANIPSDREVLLSTLADTTHAKFISVFRD